MSTDVKKPMLPPNASSKRFDMILGKQRARARLREFIKKHIFDRKNAKVLCLPGAEGREIEHVYRKLGFQDKNIFGIESDPSAVRGLKTHYPRIEVHHTNVASFCRDQRRGRFSVVSLDYCGSFNWTKMLPLLYLSGLSDPNGLADRVVVATNFFVGRERSEAQEDMKEHHNNFARAKVMVEAWKQELEPNFSLLSDPSVGDARESAMGFAITNALYWVGPRVRIIGQVEREPLDDALAVRVLRMPSLAPDLFNEKYVRNLMSTLLTIYICKYGKAFVPIAHESYSYINDRGHRMDSDFVALHKPDYRRLKCVDGIGVTREGEVFLNPIPENFKYVEEYAAWVCREVKIDQLNEMFSFDIWKRPTRVHLGGGAIPFDSEKVKAKVVELLKKGRSDDEIMSKFPVTIGTLRALKAHITMKTF